MARLPSLNAAVLAFASAALVSGQSSVDSTATSAGTPTTTLDVSSTTYSIAFTVPADADNGPNLLPNIKNTTAVQAQDVCPGYKASSVSRTANGFTATLALAGSPVGPQI